MMIGQSSKDLLIVTFFSIIEIKIQQAATDVVIKYKKTILLNSKSSLVFGKRMRGIAKKRT